MDVQQGGRRRISRFRQILWHLNRLPTGHVVKAGLRAWYWRDLRQRKMLARRLPPDPRLDALAQAFNRDGYVLLESVADPELLLQIARAGEEKMNRANVAAVSQLESHKTFWSRLLDDDMRDEALPIGSIFVRFALQPAVISVLARILGEIPRLDSVLLTYSRHTNAPLSYSQLWHRDHDDTRTIKLFVYLTDVDSIDDGPFSFLPAQASGRFTKFTRRSHKTDDAVFALAKPEEKVQVLAPRLSVFLVETSRCLHMGSRLAAGHTRLLYTACYFSAPRMYPAGKPRFILDQPVDEVEGLVLQEQ
jgi:hypothetical protein